MVSYNVRSTKTAYRRFDIVNAMCPALEMAWTLRGLFGIRAGEGRITNMDESMTYKFQPSAQSKHGPLLLKRFLIS